MSLGDTRAYQDEYHLKQWSIKGSIVLGLLMLVLPLAYPDYFFPLVWGAPAFLLDPLCAKFKARSLLKDGQKGEWTALVRLLAAGLLCGAYWELCNFWSLEKWIYTVPFFSQGKLFEMPYLGFLGFPPFGVTCFVMTNAVYLLRGGRHWDPDAPIPALRNGVQKTEKPAQPIKIPLPLEGERQGEGVSIRERRGYRTGSKRDFRVIYLILAVGALALSEWTYGQMKVQTIDSRAEPLEEILQDISPAAATKLGQAGWRYPEQVLDNWTEARKLMGDSTARSVRRRLELASLLHLGGTNARLLEIAGVDSREELARQNVDILFHRITRANEVFGLRISLF